jgi:hypothetical protein
MVNPAGRDTAGSEGDKSNFSASAEARDKGRHATREQMHQVWLLACCGMVAMVSLKAGGKRQPSSCRSVRQKK